MGERHEAAPDVDDDRAEVAGPRISGMAPARPRRDRGVEDLLERVSQSPPAADPWLGRTVADRYRVLSVLADGGMSRIYAAEQIGLGAQVAIKVLPADRISAGGVERFRREARASVRLRSPHLPTVLDFGQLPDDSFFMVMERLLGEDLAQRLARERLLPAPRALRVLRQVANALDVAHAQGFVHRDLKPENVFLVTDLVYEDFVKVLDFGIAKEVLRPSGSLTGAGTILGTPGFLPPEQALSGDGAVVTPASDVYSLCAMALELLTGELPHPTDRPMRMLERLVSEPPRSPSELGLPVPGLDEVFAKGLARDPEARFQSAGELVDALEAVLAPRATDGASRGFLAAAAAPPTPADARAHLETLDAPREAFERPADPPVSSRRRWWPVGAFAFGLALGAALGYLAGAV
ncbi:MAG TPA: serine/threonine-protein kinase [Sandaracinaceae bacterium LLY-WYZ-13_1]|nr:serine/threonine-protein kinase [Sandaracinaceae bacterium LLY-WYZ-13_1]